MPHWRAIFVSDIHIGAKASRGSRFRGWLAKNTADVLYIVGDLFDGLHAIHAHDLIETLREIGRFPRIVYVPGNHDAIFRRFVGAFGHVEIRKQITHVAKDGKRYLLTHGDQFDGSLRGPLLPWLGSYARYITPSIATRAVNRMATGGKLDDLLSGEAVNHDGIITGHYHNPGIRSLPCGRVAVDCGDWFTNLSAVVETDDGRFELVRG